MSFFITDNEILRSTVDIDMNKMTTIKYDGVLQSLSIYLIGSNCIFEGFSLPRYTISINVVTYYIIGYIFDVACRKTI